MIKESDTQIVARTEQTADDASLFVMIDVEGSFFGRLAANCAEVILGRNQPVVLITSDPICGSKLVDTFSLGRLAAGLIVGFVAPLKNAISFLSPGPLEAVFAATFFALRPASQMVCTFKTKISLGLWCLADRADYYAGTVFGYDWVSHEVGLLNRSEWWLA